MPTREGSKTVTTRSFHLYPLMIHTHRRLDRHLVCQIKIPILLPVSLIGYHIVIVIQHFSGVLACILHLLDTATGRARNVIIYFIIIYY